MHVCESDIPTSEFLIKEPCKVCHLQFVRRSSIVSVGGRNIVITVIYEHCILPVGFSLGRHVYSITLIPGEVIELEVFRSSKLSTDISRQYSAEETYSQEFASSVQEEWSTKETSNFKIGGGVSASLDLGIIKFGVHAEPEYSTSTEEFHKAFTSFSSKASAKVSRKFDLHIDTKSEVTEGTRSVRTIRNNNQCQTVTYHYFQIARLYKNTLTVVDVRFDVVPPQPPPLYTTPIKALVVNYRVEPPHPEEVLTQKLVTPPIVTAAAALAVPSGGALAATLVHPDVGDELAHPVRELSLEQLEAELKLEGPAKEEFDKVVKGLLDKLKLTPGSVVASFETCINTPGLYADCITGECAACDTHSVNLQTLEEEKLALENERLKKGLP